MTNQPTEPRTNGQHVERGGLWGLFLSAAGLLLPPFGVLLSVFGIFQGRRARRAAREQNGQAPGAVLSMVLGWIGVVMSAFAIIGYAVFWDEYSTLQQCSARAHTVSSQKACDDTFREAVAKRAGIPEESVPMIGQAL